MKSIAKPFIEYGPIVVFFIFFFKTGEIQGAIVPLMLAAVVAMVLSYIVEKKISPMLLFSSILILTFDNKINSSLYPIRNKLLFKKLLIAYFYYVI